VKLPARLIDSHVHFYDRARQEGISWPPATHAYPANALPANLVEAVQPIELAGVMLIETGARPVDDEWLLSLAKNDSLILGVIANLQPLEAGFEQRLERLVDGSKLKGIRLRPIDQYDLKSPVLQNRLHQLSRYGLTLELGATTLDKLKDYTRLAKELADTRCGLTHFGHPVFDGQPPEINWHDAVLEFSALPNTFCKFTSLQTFVAKPNQPDIPDLYKPTIDFLISTFGQNRVVFGSNWPHKSVAGRYLNNLSLYQRIFGESKTILDQLFFLNTANLYGLELANNDT
jgi:predicted TIM-barrel fold metal-dependent hydrolase